MAKEKRFPAAANQKNGAAPAKLAAAPAAAPVAAKPQKTVQVHYKKKNTHVLGIGAHSIAEGVNTLPANVWEDAQKHPSVQALMKSGDLVDMSAPDAFEEGSEDDVTEAPPADSGLENDSDESPEAGATV